MITLGVQESYCTTIEADVLLDINTAWQNASDDLKSAGLLAARYYIDITFTCDLTDYDTIPDELKYANALLAADYVVDTTVFDSDIKLKELEVEAEGVSSRKVFSTPKQNKPKSLNTVKGVLKSLCSYSGGLVSLIRA